MIEDFGIDDFGLPEPEPVAEVENPAELKAVIEDLNKQIAMCMVDETRERLRFARKAAQDRLTALLGSKSETQWLELSRAYKEFFGNDTEFRTRFAAKKGASDTAFEELRHELAEAHTAKEAIQKTSKPRGRKAAKAPEPPVAEGVEEFGLGETPAVLSSTLDQAAATNAVAETLDSLASPASSTPFFSDGSFEGMVDPETGEVLGRHWFLDRLGWLEFPKEPTREQADRIVDVLRTYYLDPATRYRLQAEKLAAPLEKRAEQILRVFGPYLDAVGAKFLPKIQKGANAGKYSKKTLDLPSGSISWVKDGGISLINPPKFHVWVASKKAEMLELRAKGTPEALEELKALETLYGLKLATEAVYDKDKIKAAKQLPPGWDVIEVDEFASRSIK